MELLIIACLILGVVVYCTLLIAYFGSKWGLRGSWIVKMEKASGWRTDGLLSLNYDKGGVSESTFNGYFAARKQAQILKACHNARLVKVSVAFHEMRW